MSGGLTNKRHIIDAIFYKAGDYDIVAGKKCCNNNRALKNEPKHKYTAWRVYKHNISTITTNIYKICLTSIKKIYILIFRYITDILLIY